MKAMRFVAGVILVFGLAILATPWIFEFIDWYFVYVHNFLKGAAR